MSLPPYPRYRDSGVEWLGEVPEHWDVKRLKRFSTLQRGHDLTDAERTDGVYPVVTSGGVSGTHGSFMARGPGVVTGRYGSTGRLFYVEEDFWPHNTSLYVVDFHGNLPRFVWYSLQTVDFSAHSAKAAVPGIDRNDIHVLPTVVPPLVEQVHIAAFLDRETAKIDALVTEQQRLVELLKEKRQAVISHAVTKGLNPNAPMKDSGIEWLGEVPAHWDVTKMKWVAKMESGHTPDKKIAEYWDNGDIPWVSLNDTSYLKDHDYISETAYAVTQLGIDNSSAHLLPPNAVVFSRDATIGRCAITTRPMAVSQHFIAWVCGETIIPEFLLLRLRSMTRELDRMTTGATLKTIGMPEVKTLVTPVPPLSEQRTILEWVASQTGQIDALTLEANRAIELLQERRTALISAAVTGKIDVRP